MAYERISISRMSGALGVELGNIDLSQPHDPDHLNEVRDALYEWGVIILRRQNITSEQYLAFARHFGDILPYPLVMGLPDYPDIVPVLKKEDERVNFGGIWHSDTTYLERPPMGSMLLAKELPPQGGGYYLVKHDNGLRNPIGRHESDARRADRNQQRQERQRCSNTRG